MDKDLRGIILKSQNRLSDDDRLRLHFLLGNHVPRSIRDDLSFRGTLKLMESLIDQDKINEQDFTFLINAFDEIQCIDAAKLLRGFFRFLLKINFLRFFLYLEHLRQNQSNGLNQSIQSLSLIMPPLLDDLLRDQTDGGYVMEPRK